MAQQISWHLMISLLVFTSVTLLVVHGWRYALVGWHLQTDWYQRVLVHQLMLKVRPAAAVVQSWACVVLFGLCFYVVGGGIAWFAIGAGAGGCLPWLIIRHLEQKRRDRLERQLVDGITTLASGIRAGLNMVQSIELLVANTGGPIHEEFEQLLREYRMGMDLNHAMRRAADRIRSTHYRLLFSALQMHRRRGGDVGATLDSLAESIREIQRLEGKLDAVTAQGRTQARMMAVMPLVLLALLYAIEPDGVGSLFTDAVGRIILAIAAALVAIAFWWIKKIMTVDI